MQPVDVYLLQNMIVIQNAIVRRREPVLTGYTFERVIVTVLLLTLLHRHTGVSHDMVTCS